LPRTECSYSYQLINFSFHLYIRLYLNFAHSKLYDFWGVILTQCTSRLATKQKLRHNHYAPSRRNIYARGHKSILGYLNFSSLFLNPFLSNTSLFINPLGISPFDSDTIWLQHMLPISRYNSSVHPMACGARMTLSSPE